MVGTVLSILEKTRVFFCIFGDFCYVEGEMGMRSDIAERAGTRFVFYCFERLFSLLWFLKEDEKKDAGMSETKKSRKVVTSKRAPARAAVVSTPKKRAPRAKQDVVEEIFEVEVAAPAPRKARQPAATRKTTKVEKVVKPVAARKTAKAAPAPVEEVVKPTRRAKTQAAVAEAPAKVQRAVAKTTKATPAKARAKVVAAEPDVAPVRGRKPASKAVVAAPAPAKPVAKAPRKRADKVEEADNAKNLSAVEKLRIVQERRRRKRYERLAAEAEVVTEKAAPARKRKVAATRKPRAVKA